MHETISRRTVRRWAVAPVVLLLGGLVLLGCGVEDGDDSLDDLVADPSPTATTPSPDGTAASPTATTPSATAGDSAPDQQPEAAQAADDCDAYVNSAGWCEDGIGDFDCAGGSGDGPHYVSGPVDLVDAGNDPFGLDGNGDGTGCESGNAPPPEPEPEPEPDTDPRFDTCGDAIDAGYGPYHRGQDPEYDWYRDADGDGVVCER